MCNRYIQNRFVKSVYFWDVYMVNLKYFTLGIEATCGCDHTWQALLAHGSYKNIALQ